MLGVVRTQRHPMSIAARVASVTGALLCAAGLFAQDIEELAPLVLEELKAAGIECPEDLRDGWTCGQYRSGFSRLKFELEVELDLKAYEARPLTSWRLRDGRYERSWAVHGFEVTMKFGRTSKIVALRQQPLDEEPEAEESEESKDESDSVDDDDDEDEDQDNRGA